MNAEKPVLLIVEDEPEIAELIEFHAARSNMSPSIAPTGRKALESVDRARPDVIVLDLMLPDLDGLEVCRRLKAADEHKDIPIVMVTAKGEESDIVAGLELGADDYVTKPFSPRVLMARLRNVLRRNGPPELPGIEGMNRLERLDGRLLIDLDRHEVRVEGAPVDLTLTEFGILRYLAERPGFVRTRSQIIAKVHGRSTVLSSRTIDVHITALRRKIGAVADSIETVRGVGYRFAVMETAAD